ncbi:hypothetical protein [Frigoribacterium sp. MCBA15_019]|uniref:hypothetical protein n=1 Tax=Frigoribacterium sp. MCBA15_019 TaxID=1898745 RepID=UPI0008DCAE03|nr:hypothetical protein [Frigoribacterium sp. MCBA15_019]OII26484.1 hypothetical protein BIV04_13605 [Frigoribacterium sp. MCBA15_019]
MTSGAIDVEFATFKQHFLSRVQRRQLRLDIGQDDARGIYEDSAALHREFITWQNRGNQPTATTPRSKSPSLGPWHKWTRVRRNRP